MFSERKDDVLLLFLAEIIGGFVKNAYLCCQINGSLDNTYP